MSTPAEDTPTTASGGPKKAAAATPATPEPVASSETVPDTTEASAEPDVAPAVTPEDAGDIFPIYMMFTGQQTTSIDALGGEVDPGQVVEVWTWLMVHRLATTGMFVNVAPPEQ